MKKPWALCLLSRPDKNLREGSEKQMKQMSTRTIRRGLVGGTIGYVGGALLGNAIEQERRNKSFQRQY